MSKSLFSFQDTKYEYREYGGYIFRMPVNEDIKYLSTEKQNQYYWYLAEAMFNQIIPSKINPSSVSQWELSANSKPKSANFISFSDIKKNIKPGLIGYALGKVYSSSSNDKIKNDIKSAFQFIETISNQ